MEPLAMESNALFPIFSLETLTELSIASVCGTRIFAMAMAPGAAMTEADSRCLAKATLI
jgi:hypothetical protein